MIYLKNETVEAEIKVIMLLQRVRDAVIRMKNRLSNGPLRVQSNVLCVSYVQSIL